MRPNRLLHPMKRAIAGYLTAIFGLGLVGVACNSALPGPGGGGPWFLEGQNLSPTTIVVTPWRGGPETTLACQQSVELKDGVGGAPGLPWAVVVVRKADGKVLLDQLAGDHVLPSQEVRVETDAAGTAAAFMRDAGGSGGAVTTTCPSP